MVVNHQAGRGRTPTGGRYRTRYSKRLSQRGRLPTLTKIGEHKVKTVRTKGGSAKMKVLVAKVANLYDPKTKKYTKSPIQTVTESTANRHFVRRNILVKGTIITTDAGKARVTSRPGQDGTVNAILV